MKKLICVLLIILTVMLSSCSSFGFGTSMPDMEAVKAFESDTYIVVDNMLINKTDGSVCLLEPDSDATITGKDNIYYHGPYAYKYVFEDSSFKQYTFLKVNYWSKERNDFIDQYYECVFTYGYDGKELDREYIGEILTEDEMEEAYKSNPSNIDAFSFEVDVLWEYNEEKYKTQKQQAVLEYVENIYASQEEPFSTVVGLAKPMGEEIRFCLTVSEDGDFETGEPLLEGINSSKIVSYNPKTNEFKTVLEYEGKKQIIDFDEKGFYTFDSDLKLKYVDFETKRSTLICQFSNIVSRFIITDGYICAYYHGYDNHKAAYYYFVYQKGGSVIADDLYTRD